MLYLQTVAPALLKIIKAVCAEPFFNDFRLVGGTALSLQLGHRQSVDADFFTNKAFDLQEAGKILSDILPGFIMLKKSKHGFSGMAQGVKLDLYTWGTTFLLPSVELNGIRIAELPDLAGLKLEAVTNRKEEKDFRDVHALLQRFSMAELVNFFRERYPDQSVRILTDHLLAAPFVDNDPAIMLFTEDKWKKCSSDIVRAVRYFYKQQLIQRKKSESEQLQKRINSLKKRNK